MDRAKEIDFLRWFYGQVKEVFTDKLFTQMKYDFYIQTGKELPVKYDESQTYL